MTKEFMNDLNVLVDSAEVAFAQADTPASLENAKALFLGKTGRITELMKGMAALSVEEKKITWRIDQSSQAVDRGSPDQATSSLG